MLFKGTKKRSAKMISETIESFGGYLNAFTSKENTCYYGRGLAKHIPKTFDVIGDMIQNPLFRQSDIKKESGVIIDELNDIEDNPEELIFDKFEEILFKGNPLAFPIIGNESSIASFNHEALKEFHSDNYALNNLLISASGDIDHEQLKRLAEKYLTHANRGKKNRRKWVSPVKNQEVTIFRDISQVHCIIGRMSYGYKHEERLVLNLLSQVLGEGSSSRLYQAVREKEGITYQINTFVNSYYDTSAFGVYFSTNDKNSDKALQIISKELKKLKTQRVSDRELKRVKECLKGNIILSLENTTNRMIRMSNSILNYNRIITVDEIIGRIDKITGDQILEMADTVLDESTMTKVVLRSENPKEKIIAA